MLERPPSEIDCFDYSCTKVRRTIADLTDCTVTRKPVTPKGACTKRISCKSVRRGSHMIDQHGIWPWKLAMPLGSSASKEYTMAQSTVGTPAAMGVNARV